MKKIAVIGAGASGLGVALGLKSRCHVDIFEASDVAGGHARSFADPESGGVCELGAEYFSELTAPNLIALLDQFEIRHEVSLFHFSYYNRATNTYWNNYGTTHPSLYSQMVRFESLSANPTSSEVEGCTVASFLEQHNFSSYFRDAALLPIMSSFASSRASLEEFPISLLLWSFNQGLLSFFKPTPWRRCPHGLATYGESILKLDRVVAHLNTFVESVQHNENGWTLEVRSGRHQNRFGPYDELVVSCDPSTIQFPEETRMPTLRYQSIYCVLHRASNLLNGRNCAYYHYEANQDSRVMCSGTLNRCYFGYGSNLSTSLVLSFDPCFKIPSGQIISEWTWRIPKLSGDWLAERRIIASQQNQRRLWFCGSGLSLTGHEGALGSGLVVANQMGTTRTFGTHHEAVSMQNKIERIMGFTI